MENIYSTPESSLEDPQQQDNNSGMKESTFPDGVKGWSWGGFLLNWIWAIGNKSYIGLLALLPYVGFIVSIYLGVKGRELAWKNKRWQSVEHFNRVQKRWSIAGLVIVAISLGLFLIFALPYYQS